MADESPLANGNESPVLFLLTNEVAFVRLLSGSGIMRKMSEQSSLVSLLGPDQDTSLHSLLQSLDCQARIMHEKVGE